MSDQKIMLEDLRDIKRGVVPNQKVEAKFGYNKDVDSAAEETCRASGGAFTPITSAETLSIVSSSANDGDGALPSSTTGMQYLRIVGLDANYNEVTEDVFLNGITPVTTTNSFIAVNRSVGIYFGTGRTNDGNITITQSTSGAEMAYILAGVGITQQLIYTVPAGYEAQMVKIKLEALKISGGGSPRVTFKLKSYVPESNGIYITIDETIDTSIKNEFIIQFPFASEIAQKTTLWLDVTTNTNNTEVAGRMWFVLYSFTGSAYEPY